jgi:hypothetical protein
LRFPLEQRFDRELCRARTAQALQCVLPALGSATAQDFVGCGIYLAEVRNSELGVWLVQSWGSEHGMVENVEIFCADIKLDSFGKVETPA